MKKLFFLTFLLIGVTLTAQEDWCGYESPNLPFLNDFNMSVNQNVTMDFF